MNDPSGDKSLYWFDVDEYGTLSDAAFVPKTRREEMYSGIPSDWSKSPADLSYAMRLCPPLAWSIYESYENARDELEEQIDALDLDTEAGRDKAAELQAKLDGMPSEPEGNAERWLSGLDDATFRGAIVPIVQKWLSEEPDYRFEDDYLDHESSAEGLAFVIFRALDDDEREKMGVGIVEGDRPGSNRCFATLQIDIKKANKAAETTRQPFRFRRKPASS